MKKLFSIFLLTLLTLSVSAQEHQITLTANPAHGGGVNFLGQGYVIYSETSQSLSQGATATCYALPNEAFKFAAWKRGNVIVSTDNPMTVIMDNEDLVYEAVFVFDPDSPNDPGVNYFNAETGEMRIVNTNPNAWYDYDFNKNGVRLMNVIENLTTDYSAIKSMTFIGQFPNTLEESNLPHLPNLKYFDLSRTDVMGGFDLCRYMPSLETLILPATITDLWGYLFFPSFPAIKDIYCYATEPPLLSDDTFGKSYDSETGSYIPFPATIHVPKTSLPLYQEAYLWKDLNLVAIDDGTLNLTVTLPATVATGAYQNMSLVLEDRATQLQTRYVVTKQPTYTFSNLLTNTSYNLRVENSLGQVIGEIKNVQLEEKDVAVEIPALQQLFATSVIVKSPNGTDLTEKVQVKWTLPDGSIAGQHPTLSNVLKGTSLNCKVQLNEELATNYSTPASQTITVQAESENQLTCQLQGLHRVTLSGQVTNALTGRPMAGVSVVLRQQVGGVYSRSSSATTDEEGRYSLMAYSENGTLSFSSTGCFTRSVDIEAPTTSQTMETVALQSLTGATIGYALTYTPVVAAGETPQKQENYSDSEVSFAIFNVTKSQELTQFVRQGYQLIIPEGADIGDELRVTLTSLTDSYAPVVVQCVIDDTNYAEAIFDIVERGNLVATPAEGSTAGLGLLYDSSGQLFRQGSYGAENLTLDNLPDGNYTLVSMGTTSFFRNVLRLSSLADAGLVMDVDYVTSTVTIHKGQQTAVNVGVVPAFNESRYYYTDSKNTYFMGDKSRLSIGDYETLKARVLFKQKYASRVSNVQLVVDLPDGVSIVPGSLNDYQLEGQRLTVNITSAILTRFCVTTANPTLHRTTAFVRFNLDGEEILQPIGTVFFEATHLSFDAQEYTQLNEVNVWGTLPQSLAGSNLEIFDNGVLVSQAIVAENGRLKMTVPIYKPLNNSWHQLMAKVVSPEAGVLWSQPRAVQCYRNTPVMLEEIRMSYYNGNDNCTIVFSKQTGNISKYSYGYNPSYPSFTFTAHFTENDPEKVKNLMFIIYLSDGTIRRIRGTYDAGQNGWFCSSSFSIFALPINVSVTYDIVIDDQNDHETMFNDQVDVMHQASLHVKDMVENHMTTTVLTDEENSCSFVMESENGRQLLCESTLQDYETIEKEMRESGNIQCTHTDDGIIAFSVKDSDKDVEVLIADSKEHVGVRVKLSDYVAHAPARARRRISVSNVLSMGFDFGGGVLDFLGFAEYFDAPSQLSQLDFQYQQNLREQQKLFDRALKRMDEKCIVSDAPALSAEEKLGFLQQQKDINEFRKQYEAKAEALINAYKKALLRKGIYDIGTTALSAGASRVFKLGEKVEKMVDKLDAMGIKNEVELLKSGLEFDYSLGQKLGVIPKLDEMLGSNFGDVFKEAMDYMNEMNGFIRNQFNGLIKNIEDTVDDNCKKGGGGDDPDPNPSPEPDPDPDPDPWPARPWPGDGPPLKPSIDPQGYVYEGVPSNRLAGVTATVYYKELAEDQNGNPVEDVIQWNAATFGQINPQITGADGMYQWFVPQGLWQVKVEKEGYETAYSEWLPVPPPQLDVNIAMKQSSAPEVKDAKAYEEGINITFDKYMLLPLLTTDNISVVQNGNPVEGTIELQDKEETADGKTFASKVRFVPKTPFTQNKVTLHVSRDVQSYAYMLMAGDYEQELTVELEVKELKSESLIKVEHGGGYILSVKALPAEAAAGKTLTAKVANDIATVNSDTFVLNEQGEAQVQVTGRLLGETSIMFTLEGTDLQAQTIVRVKEQVDYPTCATPVASLANESTVEAGTQVTLTCETENARIWYTLDGSCPCVSTNRFLYTEPIVLQEGDVTLQVMAEAENYDDSKVATYIYHVTPANTAIREMTHEESDTKNVIFNLNGQRVSKPSKGIYIKNGNKIIVK